MRKLFFKFLIHRKPRFLIPNFFSPLINHIQLSKFTVKKYITDVSYKYKFQKDFHIHIQ